MRRLVCQAVLALFCQIGGCEFVVVIGAKVWADFANWAIVAISGLTTMADFRHFIAWHQIMLHMRAHTFAPLAI